MSDIPAGLRLIAESIRETTSMPKKLAKVASEALEDTAFKWERLPGTPSGRLAALFTGIKPVRTVELELDAATIARLTRFVTTEGDESLDDGLQIAIHAALDCGLREWEVERRWVVAGDGELISSEDSDG